LWVTGSATALTSSILFQGLVNASNYGIGIGGYPSASAGLHINPSNNTQPRIRIDNGAGRYFDIYHATSEAYIDWSNNTGNVATRGLNLVYGSITYKFNQTGFGVKNSLPNYELDVSGSGNFTSNLIATGSLTVSQSIFRNQNTASLGSGVRIVSINATSSYTAAFYNYVVTSGSNSRAGQFMAVWNGGSIQYTDNSTVDIGSTSAVALTASLSGSSVLLTTSLPTAGWDVKTMVNLI
jgi:hypothetical protein